MGDKRKTGKTRAVRKSAKSSKTSASKKSPAKKKANGGNLAKYPRHSVEKALRVPRAIIDQNAGRECSDREAAAFAAVGFGGPFAVELSSAIKYGFLERPKPGHVRVTDRARQALRPQNPGDEIEALRQAVMDAPDISSVYKHYRGENLPDGTFFSNALTDKFGIPADKISEFSDIFINSLTSAKLIEQRGDKLRILDITAEPAAANRGQEPRRTAGQNVKIEATDTCFVVMPFAHPIGGYFQHIYEPAIKKAGLRPIRADTDIFGTGKIIDQIWSGINSAKVLVAELTTRNPNVFYELGLAHALDKPVVLISSNGEDVPFDLKHIRVIYYDVNDPFWGTKLIDKVAENILSAIRNPEEAIFRRVLDES
ncbi:hypothetical protein D8676_02315 [Mesorhizobium sp. YM1C-6-2]|nr:hypothetical protein D8676_02315 [Mesorhizobium sp. YM1C-6-2]